MSRNVDYSKREPRNPHNLHIWERVLKDMELADRRRNFNQSSAYIKVLKSLEKYPLPILSSDQAECLVGVGKNIAGKMLLCNKKHYSKYYDENYLKNKLMDESRRAIESQLSKKKLKRGKSNGRQKIVGLDGEPIFGSLGSLILVSILKMEESSVKGEEFEDFYSTKNVKDWYDQNFFKKVIKDDKETVISCAKFRSQILPQLAKSDFFDVKKKARSNFYKLNGTGKRIAEAHNSKMFNHGYSNDDLSRILSQNNISNQTGRTAMNDQMSMDLFVKSENSKFTYSQRTYNISSKKEIKRSRSKKDKKLSFLTKKFESIESNFKPGIQKYSSFQIKKSEILEAKVILKIDNREKRRKDDSINHFHDRLKRFNIECEVVALPIGDFLWTLELKTTKNKIFTVVLDYIIERKKADDLAASITDGRYEDQKKRLRVSGLKRVIYVIEDKLSENSMIKDSAITTAISMTRSYDRFMVHRTKDLAQTIKFIVGIHKKITKKIKEKIVLTGNGESKNSDETKVSFLGLYSDFATKQKRSDTMTVGKIFASMINVFPGFGKEAVAKVLEKFRTMREFYEFMTLDCYWKERVNFLSNFNKNQRSFLEREFSVSN